MLVKFGCERLFQANTYTFGGIVCVCVWVWEGIVGKDDDFSTYFKPRLNLCSEKSQIM